MTVFENQTREILFPPPPLRPKEVPPVRKVLVQWWGCGAAGIKSEKYFPQMVVNILNGYFFSVLASFSHSIISERNKVQLADFY